MLKKEEFDVLMNDFKTEFDQNLGSKRETLLFGAVNYMTAGELRDALLETLIRFNKDELPTVRTISAIAYQMCPEARKPDYTRVKLVGI